MRRWLTAVALGAALALAGCTEPPAGTDGDLTDDWAALAQAEPFVPEVETCHPSAVDTGYLANYAPVDCGQSHVTQTVHVGTFSGAAAEAAEPVAVGTPEYQSAYGDCDRAAQKFLGGDWRGARLTLTMILSSPPAWQAGTRWYRCDVGEVRSIDDASLEARTASLKGALAKLSPLHHQCFNPKTAKQVIEEMTAVSCTRPHRSEFVGTFPAPGTTYATFEKDSAAIHKGCRARVAAFAKVPNDSNLQYRVGTIFYQPSEFEFRSGNRSVQCFLWRDDQPLTRSVRGAGIRALPVS
jgi:putative regulator of septum formation